MEDNGYEFNCVDLEEDVSGYAEDDDGDDDDDDADGSEDLEDDIFNEDEYVSDTRADSSSNNNILLRKCFLSSSTLDIYICLILKEQFFRFVSHKLLQQC